MDRQRGVSVIGRVMRRAVSCLAAVLVWSAASPAGAQEGSGSFEELLRTGKLRLGDSVYVTDDTGERIEGEVNNFSPTSLELRDGGDRWSLPIASIRRIERQDSVVNEILIGLGVAYATWAGACHLEVRAHGGDTCYVTLYTFVPGLATGAYYGWKLDASRHATIYAAPGSARLTVAPLVSKGRWGMQTSVTW